MFWFVSDIATKCYQSGSNTTNYTVSFQLDCDYGEESCNLNCYLVDNEKIYDVLE